MGGKDGVLGTSSASLARCAQVGFSGNSSSNWLVWPMHVDAKSYEIDNIGTIYNTQTYTVRTCCSPSCISCSYQRHTCGSASPRASTPGGPSREEGSCLPTMEHVLPHPHVLCLMYHGTVSRDLRMHAPWSSSTCMQQHPAAGSSRVVPLSPQFSADFTLIAPAASAVSYDIQLNAGQFSTPYVADLLLDLPGGEGTLNVTTGGTFNGFIILGAGQAALPRLLHLCP